jgi:spore coat protein U-like protein
MPVGLCKTLCCFALALIIMAGHSTQASAQSCSFSITNLNFGSIDLTQGTSIDVTATFTATCNALLLTTVRVCPNFAAGSGGSDSSGSPRHMASGTNQLNYNLYQDAARSIVWGSAIDGAATNPPTVDIPILLLSNTTTRTIYGRIFPSQQQVATGSYLSSFAGGQTLMSYRVGTGQTCAQIGTQNGTQAPFSVQATYTPTCRVSASPLNFGTLAGTAITNGVNAATNLSATCSAGTPYSIALNGGQSGATDPTQRKLTMGAQSLIYGLYRDDPRTLPWGSTLGTNTAAGVGSGTNQSIPVYGRVPNQTVPPPGTYSDNVVVSVEY